MGEADLDRAAVPITTRVRLDPIDRLRGLVMVLMALDHVRDFFGDMSINAVDPQRTNVPLFFTRWITHYCAPTFVFLTGVGAFLYASRGRSKGELSLYLVTRGLWIAALEILYVGVWWNGPNLAMRISTVESWQDVPHVIYGNTGAGVFWAIGWSMVVLAAVVHLPRAVGLGLALAMILGHNQLDFFKPEEFGRLSWLWQILHTQGGPIEYARGWRFGVGYPLVPWIGVMAAGYYFGPVMLLPRAERLNWILGWGAFLTVAYFALRATNLYGDPFPWHLQRDTTFTVLSCLNCHKYPPSLCYLLMTLGPALLLLAAFDRDWGPVGRFLTVFGRVPMFFYLLHLPIIIGGAMLTWWVGSLMGIYGSAKETMEQGGVLFDLPRVYFTWAIVLAILYFPCAWYAGVKQRSKSVWLTYI